MNMWINLGSGQRPFEKPWINVDCQSRWKPDVLADGSNLREYFTDGSAEIIVLHHVLEHFGCGEADAMIRECYRILGSDGRLIVTVPNMRALARRWLFGTLDSQIYFTNVYGAYMGDQADRHRWGFDESTLVGTLTQAAQWSEVRAFDWREIPGSSIASDWWILGKEAIK